MSFEYGFYEDHSSIIKEIPLIYHLTTIDEKCSGLFEAHWHENLELLFFEKGHGTILINSIPHEFTDGTIMIVNSNNIHKFLNHVGDVTYHCLIIDHIFCTNYSLDFTETFFTSFVTTPSVQKIITLIIEEYTKCNDHYTVSNIRALTLMLINNLFRYNCNSRGSQLSDTDNAKIELVKEAILFISKNYTKEIQIDTISSELAISKFHLCRIFKTTTGQTINSFINECRCHKAKVLLSNTSLSISKVADESGFNDTAYFTKCYKRQYGILPSKDRH